MSLVQASRLTSLPQGQPPAPPPPAGPADALLQTVGQVISPVTNAIDSLNLGLARATQGFADMFPKMGAARLWSDLVFQFGHSHPHPPTFGFPIPSLGPILAAGAQGVLINGLPAARCGDLGLSVWCGGYFPIFEVLTGSSHVFIGGARASRTLLDPTLHCLPIGGTASIGKLGAAMMALSAGLSLLGVLSAMERQTLAVSEAEAAQSEMTAAGESSEMAQARLVSLEGTEEEAGAQLEATTTAMEAASAAAAAESASAYAAAQGVGVATAAKQLAADIAGLAMAVLMGKDPGVGFPFGLIITGSSNVLIGGFPMPGWMLVAKGLGKLLKASARGIQLMLPKGWKLRRALCIVTGHPVDVASGRMFTSQVDFEIPGRIPIVLERQYDTSSIDYEGPLGWGWTHPYDVHLWEDENQGMVVMRNEETRLIGFNLLEVGESTFNPLEKLWLTRTAPNEYQLEDRSIGIKQIFGCPDKEFSTGSSEESSMRLLAIVDRNGNTIRCQYREGLLASLNDDSGCRVLFKYGRFGAGTRLIEIRQQIADDENSSFRLASYAYNDERELSEAVDRGLVPWRYYYKDHLMIREMNRNGLSFHFEYEGRGSSAKCIHTWGDGGIYERHIEYNARARVTTVTDSIGARTTYHFNDLDLAIRRFDSMGGTRQFEYGPAGELLRRTDEIGRVRSYSYDEHYNCTRILQEDGSERKAVFDEQDHAVLIEDETGHQWHREYDHRANVIATTDPRGARREINYDDRGNVVSLRDALGRTTLIEWNRAGMIKSFSRPGGGRTTRRYDDERRLVFAKDESTGLAVRYEYDRAGRLIRIRDIDSYGQVVSSEQFDYDPEGNLFSQTDEYGRVTRYRYSGLNKTAERIDPLGYRRAIAYDTEERPIRIENERDEAYFIEYDSLDRVIKEIGFDGSEKFYTHDAAGQITSETDALNRTTRFVRDAVGRVVKRLRADLTTFDYEYDRCGRLIEVRNDDGHLRFEYDAAGNLTSELQDNFLIQYEYDAEGYRISRRTTPGNRFSDVDEEGTGSEPQQRARTTQINYIYDGDGDLSRIDARDQRIEYKRDEAGRVIERRLPNGIVETQRYDTTGRLAKQRVARAGAEDEIVSRSYRWDPLGNVTEVRDSRRGVRGYTHDGLERLQRVERIQDRSGIERDQSDRQNRRGAELPLERRLWRGDDELRIGTPSGERVVEEFEYDAAGDLLRRKSNNGEDRSFRYGRGNKLEHSDGTTLIYDPVGNLIEKRRPNGSSIHYEYDADNQLIAIVGNDQGRIEFAYDALGRRKTKQTESGSIGFIWDSDVLCAEHKGLAANYVEYVHAPGSFVPAARLRFSEDGICKAEPYHVDYLGTPREVTDAAGRVVWEGTYDEYGELTCEDKGNDQNIRFQGQYEDRETGLYYNRYRYYDPDTGRYITKDPSGLAGGFNAYRYTPNPVVWLDPYGLKECLVISAESRTLDLEGDWRSTKFSSKQGGIVYVLRDVNTGEFLKVGKSETGTFVGRFEKYQAAGKYTGRHLALDVFTVDKGSGRTVQSIESEIRTNLGREGHKLPWDNTDQRLGREGPGVPGTRLPRRLRESYQWQGENLVPKQ